MNKIFKEKYKHIHFIGIGGISMSGLAEILFTKGFEISGSDMKSSAIIEHLQNLGVNIKIGHNENNITEYIDLVVYTAAVKGDNPELVAAKKHNIKIIDRAELLGHIMDSYKYSIAVSGTHGKTTTSSMVSEILLEDNSDPTISIGGILPSINGNIKIGSSDYFVAEACEYFESFLKFKPFVGVILNIEADHLDYFKDLNHIRHSFHNFANRIPVGGSLIINSKIENLDEIISNLNCNVITYGVDTEQADWTARNVIHEKTGKNSFDAYFKNQFICRIYLNIPGDHNISNALAACAATYCLGAKPDSIVRGLSNFKGTQRRFQFKGKFNGVTVIDDYAHHPTEILATLSAAKKVEHNKLWCVFQPHTFSRTKAFINEFAHAFEDADNIVIAKIYAAREKDTGEISGNDLAEKIKDLGKNVVYFNEFEEIEKFLLSNCKNGDLLITMGAGDINLVGEHIISE